MGTKDPITITLSPANSLPVKGQIFLYFGRLDFQRFYVSLWPKNLEKCYCPQQKSFLNLVKTVLLVLMGSLYNPTQPWNSSVRWVTVSEERARWSSSVFSGKIKAGDHFARGDVMWRDVMRFVLILTSYEPTALFWCLFSVSSWL